MRSRRYMSWHPGGKVATSDFVDSEPAVQLEDERLQAELRRGLWK